jgi:hypothetical protein
VSVHRECTTVIAEFEWIWRIMLLGWLDIGVVEGWE